MNKMKYLIVMKHSPEIEVPIVFHPAIRHGDISVTYLGEIVSAGFCEVDESHFDGDVMQLVQAWGRSDSLNIESREGDGHIIHKMLFPDD